MYRGLSVLALLLPGVFIEAAKNPTLRVPVIWRSESLHSCVYLASDKESVGALVCNCNVNEAAPLLASLNVIG
jgi:hypothetical protein